MRSITGRQMAHQVRHEDGDDDVTGCVARQPDLYISMLRYTPMRVRETTHAGANR